MDAITGSFNLPASIVDLISLDILLTFSLKYDMLKQRLSFITIITSQILYMKT